MPALKPQAQTQVILPLRAQNLGKMFLTTCLCGQNNPQRLFLSLKEKAAHVLGLCPDSVTNIYLEILEGTTSLLTSVLKFLHTKNWLLWVGGGSQEALLSRNHCHPRGVCNLF